MILPWQKTLIYRAGAIALLLIGVFAFAHSLSASVGLTIQPLKVTETLTPGASVSGAVSITNASDEAVNVEVKVEDFVPLAGTYNIQFVGRAPGVSTVRDWVTLDGPKSFVLKKGEGKNVSYTIQAPPNAEPGGHFGVAFFKATLLPTSGGQQLRVGTQVGMLILVTIPGSHLEKGTVLDFSGPFFVQKSPIDFKIKFENTGTVHFEPKGKITITNMFGKEVGTVLVGGQVVLPTGIKDLTASVNFDGVLLGRYTATLKIFDGVGDTVAERSLAFYAFPLWYILAFLITVLVLFFGIKFFRKNIKISFKK
ncbi:hypothetical protein A2118_02495 [Candidatus Kaiserbacteria bacterium GWA2_50_9]|uniref:Uncharacterized protein n=1 Tax=Candidatus Kaiserbacteria bacterium GWA2_50_9 TaxID=1798474 RepID=A0A1F6BWM7_9BACT|nr:MAG: hypothetical protein A2118_02495 [Candidatus Kaiserbacteria bacterium GWA2_50_9]